MKRNLVPPTAMLLLLALAAGASPTGLSTVSIDRGASATWGADSSFADFTNYIYVDGATLQKMQRVYARAREIGRAPLHGNFGFISDSFGADQNNYRALGIEAISNDSTGGNWYAAFVAYLDSAYAFTGFINGIKHGNFGGWTLADLYGNNAVDSCLINTNPSWAIIDIGTNDIGLSAWAIDSNPGRTRDDWGDSLATLCARLDSAGCIPVIATKTRIRKSTEPGWNSPDQLELDRQLVRVALENNWPILDFQAAFLGIAPDSASYFGSADDGLVRADDVHPSKCDSCSVGVPRSANFSRDAFTGQCGYCVRQAMIIQFGTFLMNNVFADTLAYTP